MGIATYGMVFTVGGTDKVLLLRLKLICPALVHLAAAIGAKQQAGKHTHIAHFD